MKQSTVTPVADLITVGKSLQIRNPCNGVLLGELMETTDQEVREAIDAAAEAFKVWSVTPGLVRGKVLMVWAQCIRANEQRLAHLLSAEQGKPVNEAKSEIAASAAYIEFFAAEAGRIDGEEIGAPSTDRRLFVAKKPVGVCAAITPWNFPASMVARKLAPALAAGCTVVLKPSELTPLIAIEITRLAVESGVPHDAIKLVHGNGPRIGELLCSSSVVRKLSFTGSTRVGVILYKACASTMKRLSLELGGNAPFVVLDDANVASAVQGAIAAKFRNGGQSCVAANRFIVHSAVHDEFVEKLTHQVNSLKVGSSAVGDNDIGPMISETAALRLRNLVSELQQSGAVIANKYVELNGAFVHPAVLTGVPVASDVFCEEIFGPIAIIYKANSNKEALALANATSYGLASYVYTTDLMQAMTLDRTLNVGMIAVNTGFMSHEMAPFGGTKMSGLGREGSHHGIDEYSELAYTCYSLANQ